jgi:hypothetical protein
MPRHVTWSESQRQIGVALEQVKAAQESALREAQQKWFEFATRQARRRTPRSKLSPSSSNVGQPEGRGGVDRRAPQGRPQGE